MSSAFLLDVCHDPHRTNLTAWVKEGSRAAMHNVPYRPAFLVAPRQASLEEAERRLAIDARVAETWRDAARLDLGGDPRPVLRIRPHRWSDLQSVATDLRRETKTVGFHFFDVDHYPPSRWMHQNGLFPFCWLQSGSLHPDDDRWSLDYERPPLVQATLAAQSHVQGLRPEPTDPLAQVRIGDLVLECPSPDDEPAVLRELGRILQQLDPDVVLTRSGDAWDIPYLLHRIRHHDLHHQVWLGRAPDPRQPFQQEKSFHTYGHVLHRSAAHALRGRLHIDMSKKALATHDERRSLDGLVYLARISNRPLQTASRNGPGNALQQMQVDAASDRGVALPWRRNLAEAWKPVSVLCAVDRGGQIHAPPAGLHEDVWSLDFSSYYPTIVRAWNLSSETLNCNCCPDSPRIVPWLQMHVCTRRRGHQAHVLDRFMPHRQYVKAVLRRVGTTRPDGGRGQDPDARERAWAKSVKEELKALGVVCFGYFRYRNARFGCAEIHQAIQAIGRVGMTTAKSLAEDAGFRFLHGLTDSLCIQRPGASRREVQRLARGIADAVGAPMEVEGRFKWVVFLPSKENPGVGVPNRYYGLFEDGSLKLRGIETRRHSTPPFLVTVQEKMLEVLAEAEHGLDFHRLLPRALGVADEAAAAIRSGQVPPGELAVTITATRSVEAYKASTGPRAALHQLRDAGIEVRPGQQVRYVVCRPASHAPARQRVVPLQLLETVGPLGETPSRPIDKGHYLRLLARSVETLLSPFGQSEERMMRRFARGGGRAPATRLLAGSMRKGGRGPTRSKGS